MRTNHGKRFIKNAGMPLLLAAFLYCICLHSNSSSTAATASSSTELPRINTIRVAGNKHVPEMAILYQLPFRPGDSFDPAKTSNVIRKLYTELKRLRNIGLYGQNLPDNKVNILVVVEEKRPVREIKFIGNKQISEKDLKEKVSVLLYPAIDLEELPALCNVLKTVYAAKGYHDVDVSTEVTFDQEDGALISFIFSEKPRTPIRRILFEGNESVSAKELKGVLLSSEDWVFSFMDGKSAYHPDRVEGDRYMIEQFYQNNGYLTAKVVDTKTQFDEESKNVDITFVIREGDQYTISDVNLKGVPDKELEKALLNALPIKAGTTYSREAVVDTIKFLEATWGNQGHIGVQVDPAIEQNEEQKTASITFSIDPGQPVILNKILISGNKKSDDRVIRRHLALAEGGLLTQLGMEVSKSQIEGTGYVKQRDGVVLKPHYISPRLADLEVVLDEARTGNAEVKVSYGGSPSLTSASSGIGIEASVSDMNFLGTGRKVNFIGRAASDEKMIVFNFTDPFLFDKPIHVSTDVYHKRTRYDQFHETAPVNERVTGGALAAGVFSGWVFPNMPLYMNSLAKVLVGVDSLFYGNRFMLTQSQIAQLSEAQIIYHQVLRDKLFLQGSFGWLALSLGQERINHPVHPTEGYSWNMQGRLAFPVQNNLGFGKFDCDYHWFTPLVGLSDLVFHFHAQLGVVMPMKNRVIPYRELYHIGGPASVRGYIFGEISPRFLIDPAKAPGDSIGGRKMFFINSELIFPISEDKNMKAILFYDGGAGWDNPYAHCLPPGTVRNNNFDYRHSVGVGLRLLSPMPIRVDWGFKLDPRKGEKAFEVHFSMDCGWA